ncbi:MAG: hypothetical protein EXR72_13410 [Myxococcales bacterium]|nr:hypothetical protein [Myxococcales bacterium]
MPRVLDGGPALTASADGAFVAVLDQDRLSLIDAVERRELAEAVVPATGRGELAFVGAARRILTVTHGPEATTLHAYATPSLELTAKLEITGSHRALAFIGERVLLVGDEGEGAKLATLGKKSLSADLIPLRGPVLIAAAAPEDRLVVTSRGQLEFWDLNGKLALFRLNLPLPPTISALGFAGRGRLLWVSTGEAGGHFEVFRFSDGRRQLAVDLGAPIVAIEGSVNTNRIVVAQRKEGGAIELTQLDLGLRERRALTIEPPIGGFVVVEGEQPLIVVASAGTPLTFLSLGKASGGARPIALNPAASASEESPGSPPRSTSPEAVATDGAAGPAQKRGTTAADRFAAWRSRLHGGRPAAGGTDPAAPGDPPGPRPGSIPMAPPEPAVQRSPEGASSPSAQARAVRPPLPARRSEAGPAAAVAAPPSTVTAPGGAPGASPFRRLGQVAARATHPSLAAPTTPLAPPARPSPAETARSARVEPARPASLEPRRPSVTAPASGSSEAAPGWRGALVQWARTALATNGEAPPPPLDETAIAQLADRFALEPVAVRALALLYGAWLLGEGREGLAASRVAAAIGDDVDWPEALGVGQLARLGIARARRGRLVLRRVAGRFLDGAPVRVPIAKTAAPSEHAPFATSLVPIEPGEPLTDLAARLAERLGRDLALIDLAGPATDGGTSLARRLADGLFEARATGAVPLIAGLPADDDPLSPLERLGDGPALIAVGEACAPSLAHLPHLPTD